MCLAVIGYLFWRGFSNSDHEEVNQPRPGADGLEEIIALQEGEGGDLAGQLPKAVEGGRLDIYDRNLRSLATSFKLVSVYVRPLELKDSRKVIAHLSQLLALDEASLLVKMQNERGFVWLKRNVEAARAKEIADLGYDGVYLVDEWQRYYPYRQSAAHVIGFVKEEQALAGIEFFYDNVLRGGGDRDLSSLGLFGQGIAELPAAGAALILTLDVEIQKNIEKALRQLMAAVRARAGMAVLMDVSTGAVLALANLPSYDPNKFWKHESYERRNRVILDFVPLGGLAAYFRAAAELRAGNIPGPLLESAQVANLIIKPRQRKIIRARDLLAQNGLWQLWAERAYLSPRFAWEADFLLTERELAAFGQDLVIAKESLLDLPEHRYQEQVEEGLAECNFTDSSCQATTINLINAYSRILNNQQSVQPHLLDGLWYDQASHPVELSAGPEADRAAVSTNLFEKFLEQSGAATEHGNLVIETLVAEPDKIPEMEIAGEGAAKDEAGTEEVGGERVEVFSALALGSTTQRDYFQLAVVVSLDGAQINLEEKSPLRGLVDGVLNDGYGALMKARKKGGQQPQIISPQEAFQRWQAIHQKTASPANLSKTLSEGEMPDLRGFSLRKALQILEGYDLHIQISGSGTVVSQVPASGTKVVEGGKCLLRLKAEMPN